MRRSLRIGCVPESQSYGVQSGVSEDLDAVAFRNSLCGFEVPAYIPGTPSNPVTFWPSLE
jgi:hypothetical protein